MNRRSNTRRLSVQFVLFFLLSGCVSFFKDRMMGFQNPLPVYIIFSLIMAGFLTVLYNWKLVRDLIRMRMQS